MSNRRWLIALLFCGPVFSNVAAGQEPLTIRVDVSEASRRFLRATIEIPAKPGSLTLYYPKWIPGEHGPTGPINDLAGIKMKAAGKDVRWQRDEVDMYAFHCQVPEGADRLEVTLNFLSPAVTAGFSSGASLTSHIGVINWNQTILYPKGTPAKDIVCKASILLPEGWKLATALATVKQLGTLTEFAPVSLETLIDSPVLCGDHLKEVPIGPKGGPPHYLVVAADSAGALAYTPEFKSDMDRLIVEAEKLFGARPYKSYRFLLALSDQLTHFGLEHHESSDNRVSEGALLDDRMKKSVGASLLPHEYVHSWNGKYRRPADMVTATYQEPQRTKLLWVYEGLTQYLGVVLTARCGLWKAEQFRDNLAQIGDWASNQRGRAWRPLEDTTVAAQLLYNSRGDWASWRRGTDFYDEGILLWLEIDTVIRARSKGAKSLDDFCRRFFASKGGTVQVKPFTFDEMIADLNAVTPHDWAELLNQRLRATSPEAPLEGIRGGGWKLTYGEKANDLMKENDGENKTIDVTASLGMLLNESGGVTDVIPTKPAHRAGIGPGMRIIAVNGRRWSDKLLRNALTASKSTGKIEFIVENGEFFQTIALAYRDGERYPRLVRETGTTDYIEAIVRPLAK